jgi:hypothetical protein
VLLAASSLLEGIGGLYFEDCNEAQQVTERSGNFIGGYATHAVDPESAERPLELIPETDFVERVLGGGATGLSSLPSGLGRTLPGGLQPVLKDRATANCELAVATSIYCFLWNLTRRRARASPSSVERNSSREHGYAKTATRAVSSILKIDMAVRQ